MRDHRKLRAFQAADEVVLAVYKGTVGFPKAEQFGLVAQMRRAAVSVVSNLVEGCSRTSEIEYLRFIEISLGSARELAYQCDLSRRLGFWTEAAIPDCDVLCGLLARLHQSISKPP